MKLWFYSKTSDSKFSPLAWVLALAHILLGIDTEGRILTIGKISFLSIHRNTRLWCFQLCLSLALLGFQNTISYAQCVSINPVTCDSDGDGVVDSIDIDDDNDGILDIVEDPNCEKVINGSGANGFTGWTQTGNVFSNAAPQFSFNYGETAANGVMSQVITTVPNQNLQLKFDAVGWGGNASGNVSIRVDVLTGTTVIATKTIVKTFGNPWTNETLDFIPGTNQTTIKFTDLSTVVNDFDFVVTGISIIAACGADTDNDGVFNQFDLDSDGDGCSDAFEAGATTNTTANYKFTGTVGTNGLDNSLETVADNGTVNYTATYANATNASIKNCTDTDGDGVGDSVDIDDDNDGILDNVECTYQPAALSSTWTGSGNNWSSGFTPTTINATFSGLTSIAGQTMDRTGFSNAAVNTAQDIFFIYTTGSPDGSINFTFNKPVQNPILHIAGIGGISGTNLSALITLGGGLTWTQLSSSSASYVVTSNTVHKNVPDAVLDASGSLQISGTVSTITLTFSTQAGSANGADGIRVTMEVPTAYYFCQDTDNDSTPDYLDLDSDADGCSYAFEAGATTNTTANYKFTGTVGTNGLDNSLETAADNGIINYTSTYSNAINSSIHTCPVCVAGSTAPIITQTTASNICPVATADLSTMTNTGTQPAGTTLIWSTHNTPTTAGDTLTDLLVSTSGKYYAFYYDKSFDCYSPADSVTVTIAVCCANPSVGGTATYTGGTICSTANMGTITLTGQTGDVVKWQTSTNGGTSWTDIANTSLKNSYTFINAANNQQYRALLNTGGLNCVDSASTVVTITTSAAACTASSCTYSSDTFSPQISTNTSANYTTHVILINPTDGLIKYVTAAGSTSFTGVVPGDYVMYAVTYDNTMSPTPTLTVGTNITALAGCFAVSDPSVTKVCCPTIAPATVSVTAQPNCSTATGTISITAPTGVGMTYSIDGSTYTNTTGIFTGVAAGTYTVRAKNANGCVSSDTSVTVTAQPPVPAVPTLSIQQPTCSVATGTITVTAPTGAGLTYSIDGFDYSNTTGVFAGLYEDFYNVTAKNSAGCVSNVTLGIINPQPQTPTILAVSKTNPLEGNCPITNTGTITVVGGGSNLRYSIDAGATWQTYGTFTSLNGGTYTVRVNDSLSGCYVETTVGLPSANCIEICTDGIDNDGDNLVDCNDTDCMNATIATISANKTVICATGSTATLTASGGNTYLWSTGATTATINVATAGTYSVTATRGTGCTDTASLIISTPSVSELHGKTQICEGVNGATIIAYNGASYLWSTGATSASIWTTVAGTYTVTVTGPDGCTQPLSYTISPKTPLTVQCNEMPNYRLAHGKSIWVNETYSWVSLNGIPIVSHSALDTSIVVDLTLARLDSVYKFLQISTRYGLKDTDCIALKIIDCNIKPVVTVTPQTVIEDTPKQICLPYTDPNVGQTHTVVANCAPQHGTATTPSVSAGQICFTYTPTANYNGPDTICLILCDNDLNIPKCDTVKVPITVTPVNDKPDLVITTPLPVSADSTTTVCGTVTDVDLTDTHTTTIICGPLHGTAVPKPVVNGQVCFTYTPNGTFAGTDTICVMVCDNGSPVLCDTVKVVLQATVKPVAINDFNTTLRNTPVTGTVATNDKSNGFEVTFTPTTTSPNGTLIMSPDGSYLFTPMNNFVGQIDYWYKECNAANVCDSAKLSITVYAPTPLNDAPIANDDVIQTNKNLPVTGYVTSNDFDPDGDPLRVNPTPVTNPLHGTILLNPNGSYTYTPDLNFVGKDSFEYVVCDLLNICDVAKVVIYITEDGNGVLVNDKPNAQDDLAATPMNVAVTGSMRLNDSDPNAPNTTLVYNTTPLSNPTRGTVTLTANGNYTYTPTPGFFGNDEFKYVVCDAQGLCDTATVVIKVIPAVPDALNDIIATVKNTPISGNLTTNDQGNGLPYVLNTTPVQQPTNGTITILPNGTYTYTPNPGFVGDDVVKYVICNDAGVCDTASLTITVQDNPIVGINNPPVAKNDVIETFKNTQTAGTVLGNDFDIDGDPIVATIAPVVPPAHGTLILNVNGAYTYLPDPDYTGRDSFQYQICDNKAACTTAWAFIEVRNDINGTANDKPNAEDDAVTTMMGIPVSSSMKPNDSDPNNNTLTYQTTPVAYVAHGTVTINANGSYTYTPAAGYSGTDQFKYAVCDNGTPSLCDTATVYIVVPNHKPSVVDSVVATTPKDSVITVCTTITEVDSTDILAATLVCSPQHGTATPSVNGKQLCVTYTPTAGYLGTDSICVKVCDAAGLCDTVKFKFTVNQTCVNISLKVFLEGPFNTTTNLMNTTLNQRGLLPGQTPIGGFAIPTPAGQPYSGAPWNYTGSETVTNYAPTVVDWVLVSFRTSPVLGATVFRAAGLLHNDGTITFPSPCINLPTGSFYVVIEHRNHMGIMSPNAVPVVNNTMNFDFTTGQSFVLTNPPSFGQKVKSTAWMMYAGDGKKNTSVTNYDINFSDSQLWKLESGIFDQYRYGDFNMDADVNFNDSNLWKLNNGRYSGVPH